LRREARAVARLDHPGIAMVYYVGQDQHTCYMAMEYVEGVPLDRLIRALAALMEPDLTIDSVLQQVPMDEGAAAAFRSTGRVITLMASRRLVPRKPARVRDRTMRSA